MTPTDHTSLRASTSLAERICSGDMKYGEPIMVEVLVIAPPPSLSELALEMPKSSTLTSGPPSAPPTPGPRSTRYLLARTSPGWRGALLMGGPSYQRARGRSQLAAPERAATRSTVKGSPSALLT